MPSAIVCVTVPARRPERSEGAARRLAAPCQSTGPQPSLPLLFRQGGATAILFVARWRANQWSMTGRWLKSDGD